MNKTKKTSVRSKFIIFSAILLLLIFAVGSMSFIASMERMLVANAKEQLAREIEVERLRLEASVNSEIAIVLKMANSPLIRRYFKNPDDSSLEEKALKEIEAYRRAFSSKSVFWVKDSDKIFYSNYREPYLVDPNNPDEYWYNMTLHRTEVYNFNINYNPTLEVTNLWINAPVFDDDGAAIGMLGTGINLSEFIDKVYSDGLSSGELYFFNTFGEITGARDISYVENKVLVSDKLARTGEDILAGIAELSPDEILAFATYDASGVAVVGKVHLLGWYITAIQHLSTGDILNSGMTALFALMMFAIILVVIIFNIFAVRLLGESEQAEAHAEQAREAIESSINYAAKIQTNLLPKNSVFDKAFADYSIAWKPRDVVGGDIYWAKSFDKGTVLCVCDCTGHGTPGALLTMLAVSAFESFITKYNCDDPSRFIYLIDNKLAIALNSKNSKEEDRVSHGIMNIDDGCDLAVLFIANDGTITMSAGNMSIFVCDGQKVTRHKGQPISIGEGRLLGEEGVKTVTIDYDERNKFYIATDGLFDQIGGERKKQFGYKIFEQLILDNHNEKQSVISDKIFGAFSRHQGDEPRRDDIELITFKPKKGEQ
jgi:flagellar basal body-associated protein FliL